MGNQTVRQYLRIILRWWWLLIISTTIPMGISYHFASQQPDLYQAKATLVVGASVFEDPDPNRSQIDLSNTLAAAYAELVKQRPVTQAVIERLGLERSYQNLASQIGTNIRSGAQLLEIQVVDTNPEAAALIANALADELIRRSPSSGQDPQQQEFIRTQMEELQVKIKDIGKRIEDLSASLSGLTSAAEIQDTEGRIEALENVKSRYQSTYADLSDSYHAESPRDLSLFEPAIAPGAPIPSKTYFIVAIAGAAGVGLAISAILLMEYLDTSLRWEEDSTHSVLDMPVLGAIPQTSMKGPLPSTSPLGPVAEGIRAVRSNLYLMHPDGFFKTLLLTSPESSEGKSFIAANLAVVLASGGHRVIVVDADMRRPSLHEFFDLPNIVGLADILKEHDFKGNDNPPIPLQETTFDNLYFLSSGRPPADPAALLTSSNFPILLKHLKNQGDVIIIDSPPVLGPPDATVMATQVEGAILVVSTNLTKRESAQQAKEQLFEQSRVNLLGLAVNRVKANDSYYYAPRRDVQKRRWKKSREGDLLTLGQAAARLGISKEQARRWCKNERLPAIKKWLFWWRIDPERLERMLEDTWEIKTKV